MDPAAQLLHHQPDGVGSAPRTVHRYAAGPARVHGALGQDHPRDHPCQLDENGKLQPDTDTARKLPARGVKIVFSGDDGQERTLYYFSTDLSNGGVDNSKFLDFLETLAPGDGLVKSASYLPHNPGFLKVREFLLEPQRRDRAGRYRPAALRLRPAEMGTAAVRQICRARSLSSAACIKRSIPRSSRTLLPSTSAWVTNGGRTSRTCCSRSRSRGSRSLEPRRPARARAIAPDPSPTRVYRVPTLR